MPLIVIARQPKFHRLWAVYSSRNGNKLFIKVYFSKVCFSKKYLPWFVFNCSAPNLLISQYCNIVMHWHCPKFCYCVFAMFMIINKWDNITKSIFSMCIFPKCICQSVFSQSVLCYGVFRLLFWRKYFVEQIWPHEYAYIRIKHNG